jgi:hypothetical protein
VTARRCRVGAVPWLAAAVLAALRPDPGFGQAAPAGATAAVLSFIDAAAGRVEVVRHWPAAPADADVHPFVPYFWNGCPGTGAIMVLVTAPSPASGTARPNEIVSRLAHAFDDGAPGLDAVRALRRLAAGTRTPGDLMVEEGKSAVPLVADLATYERRGYAVFAFLRWFGWRCGVTLQAVPEGYGIPYVR